MEEVDFGTGGQPDSRMQRQGSLTREFTQGMSDDRRGDQITSVGLAAGLTQLYNVSPIHRNY